MLALWLPSGQTSVEAKHVDFHGLVLSAAFHPTYGSGVSPGAWQPCSGCLGEPGVCVKWTDGGE